MTTIIYYCPVHSDQILYTEEAEAFKMIVLKEEPATCPDCKKAYFKWECIITRKDE